MRGRLVVGALCGALALVGFTGCGIPERTEVQVDRRKEPATELSAINAGSEPPTRTTTDQPEEFVKNFLNAAAGEPDRAYYRVKQFIDPQYRSRLQEKRGSEVELTVVRLTDSPRVTFGADDRYKVSIGVQQIGVLRTDGTLVPPVSSETHYEFGLRLASPSGATDDGAGLYVIEPPNVLLVSDTALQDYYESRTIYFWSTDRTQLVPDLRFLPDTVPNERRLNEVVKWLVDGPSDWLRTGVVGLPDRTELINNATGGNGRWEVNLDMPGDDRTQIDQLITQLAWSLRDFDGELELKIRNNPVKVENLAARRSLRELYPLREGPRGYCVYEGAIHSLSVAGEPLEVPLDEAVNRNVVSAGLARSGEQILAALVVTASGGKQRLTVGTGRAPVTTFGKAENSYKVIGRPVWLRSSDPSHPRGLVVADGRLYWFDGNAVMTQIALNLPPGVVTAVAVSLDGQRIALIADGALYVAAVKLLDGGVTIGPSRRVITSLTGISAVDWVDENKLIVAGSAARPAIHEVTVDGAPQTVLMADTRAKVTSLSAYPDNPTIQMPWTYMYEASGSAYRSRPAERILPAQVHGVSPPPAGVRPGNPSAPFFLF
ncbi:LpqB family beta-propeller domain-containing protein [Micromonospora avicenniae]|uniref:LpqB family beta-propeller domain-containing protein n=1 Tax=Micromonospora avicenniae TaxID=1198245 RepID=UPI003416247B